MWEFIFSDVFCYRGMVERTYGIRVEIRPKEKGHNEPHCHAAYQGQEISISLITCEVLEGNIAKPKQRFAVRSEIIYPSYRHTGVSIMC